jgi:hypothetical protein
MKKFKDNIMSPEDYRRAKDAKKGALLSRRKVR